MIVSKIPFWEILNIQLRVHGPLSSDKQFIHALQAFHSKTKGWVDGSAQFRPILRLHTAHLKWESKLVTQTTKTLIVNGFILWCINECAHLLSSPDEFKSLDIFSDNCNQFQYFPYFLYGMTRGLSGYDDSLQININRSYFASQYVIDLKEYLQLKFESNLVQRNRFKFFNSACFSKLRFEVSDHAPVQSNKFHYCALCR